MGYFWKNWMEFRDIGIQRFLDFGDTCWKGYMILGILFKIISGIRDTGDLPSRVSKLIIDTETIKYMYPLYHFFFFCYCLFCCCFLYKRMTTLAEWIYHWIFFFPSEKYFKNGDKPFLKACSCLVRSLLFISLVSLKSVNELNVFIANWNVYDFSFIYEFLF